MKIAKIWGLYQPLFWKKKKSIVGCKGEDRNEGFSDAFGYQECECVIRQCYIVKHHSCTPKSLMSEDTQMSAH